MDAIKKMYQNRSLPSIRNVFALCKTQVTRSQDLCKTETIYLSHFKLHEKPFKISTDPRFFWLGEKHERISENAATRNFV